jgi:hypothetical protein
MYPQSVQQVAYTAVSLTARMDSHKYVTVCCFVTLSARASASVGHLQGGHLQRSTFVINATKDAGAHPEFLLWGGGGGCS